MYRISFKNGLWAFMHREFKISYKLIVINWQYKEIITYYTI